ncbi:MAG: hypothetical protein ACK4G1_02795, partial [Ignavibacteria bacterium]
SINDDAYHKWTIHSLDLNGLIQIDKNLQSHLNLYFVQSLREYRDNEQKVDSIRVFDNHWSKILGISFKENVEFLFNRLEFKVNYERVIIESPFVFLKVVDNLFSFYGFYQIELFNFLTPSLYAKMNKVDGIDKNLYSFGSDLTFNLSRGMNFIIGLSRFQKLYSYDERFFYNFNLNDFVSNIILASGRFNFSNSDFKFSTEIYYKKEKNPSIHTGFYSIEQNNSILNLPFEDFKAYGVKSDLSFSFWKLKSRIGLTYNDNQTEFGGINYHKSIYPRYQGQFEIFYRDLLFKSSLDLLAGLRVKVFSSFAGRSFSPSKLAFMDVRTYNDSLVNFSFITIPANFTIDLVASGKIKEAAIVYLSIENLLNRKFYLIPYYPANDIQFRFGINWEFYD